MHNQSEADDVERRTPTFALISGLPAAGGIDEQQLFRILRSYTTGAMKCRMLPDNALPTYAIALFESVGAALDAAEPGKVTFQLPGVGGAASSTVTLAVLPIAHASAAAPELHFSDTVEVEGERVRKSELAPTAGLASVLKTFAGYREVVALERGPRSVARWCDATRREQDCPHGTRCWYIHRRAFQTTVTSATATGVPRQRVPQASGALTADYAAALRLHSAMLAAGSAGRSVVVLPREDATRLSQQEGRAAPVSAELRNALQRVMDELGASGNPAARFFVKFDVPNGAPTDRVVWSASDDVAEGTPLALRRDAQLHAVLRRSAACLAVTSADQAIALLVSSDKAAAALRRALVAGADAAVSIVVEPFDDDMWAPPRQFQVLLELRREGAVAFACAAQRTAWALVDVANRRIGSDAAAVSLSPSLGLVTADLRTVNLWRQAAADALPAVIEAATAHLGAPDSPADASACSVCVNVAVRCTAARADDASPAWRVVSVHPGDEAVARSALLPLLRFSGGGAAARRIVWRVKGAVQEELPSELQQKLTAPGARS
jgi:hypothetical protein